MIYRVQKSSLRNFGFRESRIRSEFSVQDTYRTPVRNEAVPGNDFVPNRFENRIQNPSRHIEFIGTDFQHRWSEQIVNERFSQSLEIVERATTHVVVVGYSE